MAKDTSGVRALIDDLVVANRILSNEDVVDAYGHVSARHPSDRGRFFLARSLAPSLVAAEDIVEFTLDGNPVRPDKRALYLERFIHGAIFEARAEVQAVVHAHAEDTLPFGIVRDVPLKPVIHSGSFIGSTVPVWDIADRFGDTNLLVTDMEKARDLAVCLSEHSVVLMRGHGFAAAGRSLIEAVRLSIYLARNARAQFRAIQLGAPIKYLSQGEIDLRNKGYSPHSAETFRAWEYWANKAGVGKLVTNPARARKPQQRKSTERGRAREAR